MSPPTEASRKLFDDEDFVVEDEETKDTAVAGRKRQSSSDRGSPRKKSVMDMFLTSSPTKKNKKSSAAVVTPEKRVIAEAPKQDTYVPKYIHKNLEYSRESETRDLDPLARKVYAWIKDHCVIPGDFETNRKYGPLSGSCHEERVIRAYRLEMLSGNEEENHAVMCTSCATLGHSQNQCPMLV